MDGVTELFELTNRLSDSIERIRLKSDAWAKCEREYRIALAQTELEYRARKYPAVLVQDLARGSNRVADLKFKTEIAEGDYWTAIREYDALQKRITILDRQVSREWGNER